MSLVDARARVCVCVSRDAEFHRGIKARDQFVGCVRNLRLDGQLVELSEAHSVGHVNLVACPTT